MFYRYTLFVLLLSLISCSEFEMKENYYLSFEDIPSGAPRTWIPKFMPTSSTKIREKHKVDSGAILLTFYFGQMKDLSLIGSCEVSDLDGLWFPPIYFLDVSWWPYSLTNPYVINVSHDMYTFYKCDQEQAYFALTHTGGKIRGYFWRESSKGGGIKGME